MDIEIINQYIRQQIALGNWPPDGVWGGDGVVIALVDTYESLDAYDH